MRWKCKCYYFYKIQKCVFIKGLFSISKMPQSCVFYLWALYLETCLHWSDGIFSLTPSMCFFETDLIANSWCEKVIFRKRWRCNYTPDTLAKLVPSRIITLWRDDSKEDLALQMNTLTVLSKFYKNCWGKKWKCKKEWGFFFFFFTF